MRRPDPFPVLRLAVLAAALAAGLFAGRAALRVHLAERGAEELERRLELVREALAARPGEEAGPIGRPPGEAAWRARLSALAVAAGAELRVSDERGRVRLVATPAGAVSVPPGGMPLPEALAPALRGRVVRRVRRDGWLEVAIPGGAPAGALVGAAPAGAGPAPASILARGVLAGLAVVLLLGVPLEIAARRHARRQLEALLAAIEGRARGGPFGLPDFDPAVSRVGRALDALRRELEEARAGSERLRAVLASMVEGVLVVDREGRVLLANPPLAGMLGTRGPLEGHRVEELLRERAVEEALARVLRGAEEVTAEMLLPGRDPRVLLLRAGPYPREGPPEGAVVLFHDVTELRRLERMRRELVANVSHELRTPLTAIRGFAERLRDGDLPEAERRRHLEVILRHAQRLERLTDDLLALARLEGGQRPLRREPVEPAALARRLLRDLEPLLRRRGLEARLEEERGRRVRALADAGALEEVLLNLLDNAAKYTEPGGRITVRVAAEEGRVRVEVEDTGIGIPASDLPRIFERFYRVDKGRSRELGGTGLGLAIVKHLVGALGGEVAVSSRPGEGTTFRIVLPGVPGGAEPVERPGGTVS